MGEPRDYNAKNGCIELTYADEDEFLGESKTVHAREVGPAFRAPYDV